jgi:uncharacterized protein (TIGR02246 family)
MPGTAGTPELSSARFAADGSFTNVLGIVAYGRETFELRHAEIFRTIYQGSVLQQSIGRLYFIRPDVAVVDVDAAVSGYLRLPPGVQAANDGALRAKLQLGRDQRRQRMVDRRFSQRGCEATATPALSGARSVTVRQVSFDCAQNDRADLISFLRGHFQRIH